ncbi:hypothetical protein HMPREF1544_09742 [Mucor circinelloides 1006PhL]|uniref:Uncharacterized protein n=1 Tax=Mucor circinelloides f. circinelloides (strain 1006PhL) TaxID=1220926 RepID=S2J0E0_MUCC1|nr:hypothetical protein HMPREF1544_09742 [Mucor circinelloides 1006PhL]KAG1086344.1 hypothetical protein G6F42_021030 [Rhizopus arrhizus]
MFACVESPRYLIFISCIPEAWESLEKLRHSFNIDTESFGMIEGQLGTTAAAANAFVSKERQPPQINEDLESISKQLEDSITKQQHITQHPSPPQ